LSKFGAKIKKSGEMGVLLYLCASKTEQINEKNLSDNATDMPEYQYDGTKGMDGEDGAQHTLGKQRHSRL
jgi:hypothetical protein